jgi:hypothetical protein
VRIWFDSGFAAAVAAWAAGAAEFAGMLLVTSLNGVLAVKNALMFAWPLPLAAGLPFRGIVCGTNEGKAQKNWEGKFGGKIWKKNWRGNLKKKIGREIKKNKKKLEIFIFF